VDYSVNIKFSTVHEMNQFIGKLAIENDSDAPVAKVTTENASSKTKTRTSRKASKPETKPGEIETDAAPTNGLTLEGDVHPKCIELVKARNGDKNIIKEIVSKFDNKEGQPARRISEILPTDYAAVISALNAELTGEPDTSFLDI